MALLLSKLWPYLAAAIIGGCGAGWLVHRLDSASYNKLNAQFADYRAKTEQFANDAEQAYNEALEKELIKIQTTDANNAKAIQDLQNENAHIASDRDLARRLLVAARRSASGQGATVPKAPDQPAAIGASGTDGAQRLADLCADTAAEAERNANRLDALIAEIKPQL